MKHLHGHISIRHLARIVIVVTILCSFIIPSHGLAFTEDPKQVEPRKESRPIQIFDIVQGKIVKETALTVEVDQFSNEALKSIKKLVTNVTIDPKKGMAVRIPLSEPAEINNKWFEGTVSEYILFIGRSEKPYMMLFDKQKKPLLFYFKTDVAPLIEHLELEPMIENQEKQMKDQNSKS